jgi:hypothetical protein
MRTKEIAIGIVVMLILFALAIWLAEPVWVNEDTGQATKPYSSVVAS